MKPSDEPLRHLSGWKGKAGEPEKPGAGAAGAGGAEHACAEGAACPGHGDGEPAEDPRMTSPADVKKVGEGMLQWTWGDGHVSPFPLKYLRERCPCASCVDEFTGQRRLDPKSIGPDIKIARFEPVGLYAVRFEWSDGHNTGLYSFRLLRDLCPCEACRMG